MFWSVCPVGFFLSDVYASIILLTPMQDYQGISNAAPADCPLIPLMVPKVEPIPSDDKHAIEARIHDYISNLCFSISPTAFFQVRLSFIYITILITQLSKLVHHSLGYRSTLLLQRDCTHLLVIGLISIEIHYFLTYAAGQEQLD